MGRGMSHPADDTGSLNCWTVGMRILSMSSLE